MLIQFQTQWNRKMGDSDRRVAAFLCLARFHDLNARRAQEKLASPTQPGLPPVRLIPRRRPSA
ncbi:MAG: hypothetical protein JNN07_06430 [Verrucomicrobiales bacterium]|nr:hypothetical protein [Verrucomicrobiales bacterium]